mmetsp:Transcript_7135/g.18472  ORF Transcript_7135/g.18472 Transcript_7135/m.18472 type:complete len:202 (+) Transcript_7135:792-1397(+)
MFALGSAREDVACRLQSSGPPTMYPSRSAARGSGRHGPAAARSTKSLRRSGRPRARSADLRTTEDLSRPSFASTCLICAIEWGDHSRPASSGNVIAWVPSTASTNYETATSWILGTVLRSRWRNVSPTLTGATFLVSVVGRRKSQCTGSGRRRWRRMQLPRRNASRASVAESRRTGGPRVSLLTTPFGAPTRSTRRWITLQ